MASQEKAPTEHLLSALTLPRSPYVVDEMDRVVAAVPEDVRSRLEEVVCAWLARATSDDDRIAALAAVGTLGSVKALALVRAESESPSPYVAFAAREAAAAIESRAKLAVLTPNALLGTGPENREGTR